MTIEQINTQQTSCAATVQIDGRPVQVAAATVSVRRGRTMNIIVNVTDDLDKLSDDDRAQVGEMLGVYIGTELRKAASLGIPLTCLPAGK